MKTPETLLLHDDDGIRVITLNRPERLNAWTYQMGRELSEAVDAANRDEAIDAIVVTGAGRGFCAGADIEAVFDAQAKGKEVREGGRTRDWVQQVRDSKPMVAAINGPAIGVGLTQVLSMDYLLAADDAKLSLRFVKMGLVPELASSQFVLTRVGFGKANELMLTGKTILGDEAAAIGLVDRVVAPDQLLGEALTIARAMGSNPHAAVRATKQLITANLQEGDLKQVQARELEALQVCYASAEHKEAIAAFLEKRPADFRSARAAPKSD